MGQPPYKPEKRVIAAAVLTVAATYGYFLIFAQFGFLKAVIAAGIALKPVMTVMGLAGLGGSALAAGVYRVERSRLLLTAGFAVSALAAAGSTRAGSAGSFYALALLVGLGTSCTTVTLAGSLRRALGAERLGLAIGLGTGLAYGCCNLPVAFQAGAPSQAVLGVLAAGAGLAGAGFLKFDTGAPAPAGGDYAQGGVVAWVVILLALVGLDSAAFYIIQHSPTLLENTWQGAGRLEANAAVHFLAALLAGLALDRYWVGRTVTSGAALLLVACGLIAAGRPAFPGTALLYAAGVSVYSTVLVFFPAYSLRPWLAGLVYAVAGWVGSAMGIGLAEGRSSLPAGAVLAAAGLILSGLLGRQLVLRRHASKKTGR